MDDWSVILQPVGLGSGWAIVAVGVYAMMRGRIVPRSSLDDLIHDRDEWRAESRLRDQEVAEKNEQLRHLAEVGLTMKQVLSTVQGLAHRRNEDEEQA